MKRKSEQNQKPLDGKPKAVPGQRQSLQKRDIALELEAAGLLAGRVLPPPAEGSKECRNGWMVFRRAVIATRRHGAVWQGDLDSAYESPILTQVAKRVEVNLFLLTEAGFHSAGKTGPSRLLTQEAVWWTRISQFDEDDFDSFRFYDGWYPPRRVARRKPMHPPGKCWASPLLFATEHKDSNQWAKEISSVPGQVIKPILLQRSGIYELVWFDNRQALLQPTFAELRSRFAEVEFAVHPDKTAIHVRHQQGLVALVWPSPVPNPETAAAARLETDLRQLPQERQQLIDLVCRCLRAALSSRDLESREQGVYRLLNALEGNLDCSCLIDMTGITQWGKCHAVELQEVQYFFKSTRVPLSTLFQCFEQGDYVATFLQEYPSVTAAQVASVLEHAVLTICS